MSEWLTTEQVAKALQVSARLLRDLALSASVELMGREDAPVYVGRGTVRRTLRWPAPGYVAWVRAAQQPACPAPEVPAPPPAAVLPGRVKLPPRHKPAPATEPPKKKQRSVYREAFR